jgi:predicted site-specific integrase-resolvase
MAGSEGATVAALNTYKKKFLKNKKIIYQTSQIVQKCQLHKQRSKRMKSKLATVVFKGQEWVVIDSTETRDDKIFCKLMSMDGTTVLHAWVDINLIVGII